MSLFVGGEQAITLIAKYSILEANVNHSDVTVVIMMDTSRWK